MPKYQFIPVVKHHKIIFLIFIILKELVFFVEYKKKLLLVPKNRKRIPLQVKEQQVSLLL